MHNSKLQDIGRGVQDEWSGSKDYYIADNVFIGRHDPNKLQSWNPPANAVKVYGQGHVVAYKYAANWHDGIDILARVGNVQSVRAGPDPLFRNRNAMGEDAGCYRSRFDRGTCEDNCSASWQVAGSVLHGALEHSRERCAAKIFVQTLYGCRLAISLTSSEIMAILRRDGQ
jgi:hypothetical protein